MPEDCGGGGSTEKSRARKVIEVIVPETELWSSPGGTEFVFDGNGLSRLPSKP